MVKRRRLRIALAVLVPLVATAAWLGARAVEARRFTEELARAREDFAGRRFASARVRLLQLAERRPGDGEVEYLLGASEKLGGHNEAAIAAWRRVPPGDPQAPLAALSLGRLALDLGRYREAEAALLPVEESGGEIGPEARRLLQWLRWTEGRHDEYRERLDRQIERADDPLPALREAWSDDSDHFPLEGVTQALQRAHKLAPEDDRVWLGLASQAVRRGRFDEAGEWLARCERAAPDDPAVLRAGLDWAEAAGRPDMVARLAGRLPASALSRARLLRLRAWLAGAAGDRAAERAALEELLATEPSQASIYERLADLASQEGDASRVADLRRRKAEAAAALARYKTLMEAEDLPAISRKLAEAAGASGRWADASAWWRLAARRDSSIAAEAEGAIARLEASRVAKTGPADREGRTLADVLGPIPGSRVRESSAVAGAPLVPRFEDRAGQAGLDFRYENGPTEARQIPETMGGGVGLIDFDGDGWLDVYAVQGGTFPPPAGQRPFGDRLYRNRRDGTFEDATASAGLAAFPGGYGNGVAVGDFDNDGHPDLFVTRWRGYALYRNRGDGTFEEATERAGLGSDRDWPMSAAWADLDGDGDLDLYVCHYLVWDAEHPTLCGKVDRPADEHSYCDPRRFPALPDHVFRNDGGKFVDVTKEAGIVDRDGRGLGVVATDLDDDGRIDLFVANDTSANLFFRNLGGFRFEERGEEAGLAASASGGYLAGMGIACGDLDGDGRIDLAVTNFFGEATTLYHNHGNGLFSDRGAASGLSGATRSVLGFGIAAADFNDDGRLDLAQANGHVDDFRPKIPYQMPAQLFLGDGRGGLVDASGSAGDPWQVPRVARGLAVGDLENDGRLDLLIVGQQSPIAMLRNASTPGAGHWLTLGLVGTASNRDAVGARVTVTAGGKTQVGARFGGGSYLSAGDPRLHFGLGGSSGVDRVEVVWPSGSRQAFEGLAADAAYRLREGDPKPTPLPGFSAGRR